MSEAIYTKSQVAVIAMTVVSINTLTLGHGFAYLKGFATPVYWWIMLWLVLLPLYVRQVKQAFLFGLVLSVTYWSWTLIYPGLLSKNPWYMLIYPVFHLWYYTGFIGAFPFIYWAYNSYKQLAARDLARELGEREHMPAAYTLYQAGSITAIYSIASHAHGFWGTSILFGFDNFFYPVIIVSAWLLLPFIIKLIKPALIAGIILSVIAMIYVAIFPSLTGMEPWYIYAPRLYNFAYVTFYSITILGTYFLFMTYKELK